MFYSKRIDFLNHVRKLTEDDWKDTEDLENDEEENETDTNEGMEVDHTKIRKPGRYYKNQVSLCFLNNTHQTYSMIRIFLF